MRARYSDSIPGDAGSFGGRLQWSGARSRAILEGNWAQFTTGEGAAQGWTDISVLATSGSRTATGFHLYGLANAPRGSSWSGSASGELYGIVVVRAWTLSAGASAGRVRTFSGTALGTTAVNLRARLDLTTRLNLTAGVYGTVAGSTRYADATLVADWTRGDWSAGGLVGARAGDLRYRPWAQGWVAYNLTPAISLETALGTYPRDLTGFDHGRYINVGVRANLAGSSRARNDANDTAAALLRFESPIRESAESGDVVIERVDDATTRVTFRVAGVTSLGIAGSWNEWRAQPLFPDGAGRWTGVIPAGAGSWRFALVDQTGQYLVPSGVTKLDDDFGGEVGLLIIR